LPSFAKNLFLAKKKTPNKEWLRKTQTTTKTSFIHIQIWHQDLFESIFQSERRDDTHQLPQNKFGNSKLLGTPRKDDQLS
jgi:hypothetical protein